MNFCSTHCPELVTLVTLPNLTQGGHAVQSYHMAGRAGNYNCSTYYTNLPLYNTGGTLQWDATKWSDPLRFLSLVVAVFSFGFSQYFGEQKERTEHLLEPCSEPSTVLSILSMWVPTAKEHRGCGCGFWMSCAQIYLSYLLHDFDKLFNPFVSW